MPKHSHYDYNTPSKRDRYRDEQFDDDNNDIEETDETNFSYADDENHLYAQPYSASSSDDEENDEYNYGEGGPKNMNSRYSGASNDNDYNSDYGNYKSERTWGLSNYGDYDDAAGTSPNYNDDYSNESDLDDDSNTLYGRSRSLNGRTSSRRNRVSDFEGTNDSDNYSNNDNPQAIGRDEDWSKRSFNTQSGERNRSGKRYSTGRSRYGKNRSEPYYDDYEIYQGDDTDDDND